MTIDLLAILAMGLGGAFRSWADDRQDTRCRYTLFDVVLTAVAGVVVMPLLRYWSWSAGFVATLHPIAMLGILFLGGACFSLAVFQAVRLRAPGLVMKAVDDVETKL